jgi:hypothetical protein
LKAHKDHVEVLKRATFPVSNAFASIPSQNHWSKFKPTTHSLPL